MGSEQLTNEEMTALIRKAIATVQQMSDDQLQAMIHHQRLSFAFGNVAIDNPNVTRQMVIEIAAKMAPEAP